MSGGVELRVGKRLLRNWDEVRVPIDMLTPSDSFSLAVGDVTKREFDACKPDSDVEVRLSDRVIMSGIVDSRRWMDERGQGSRLEIEGRDMVGRLLDESMPLMAFSGMTLLQVAEKCCGDWMGVVLSNAQNRSVVVGRGAVQAQLKAASEPIVKYDGLATMVVGQAYRAVSYMADGPLAQAERKQRIEIARLQRKLASIPPGPPLRARKKTDPGESRWETLSAFLEEAGLLAWATGAGQLYIGLPNYQQAPAFRFCQPKAGSTRAHEGNVESFEMSDDLGDRYSKIVALGSKRADSANTGAATKRRGVVRNGPADDGTGKDFEHPKVLFVVDNDLRDLKRAEERATKEMAYRDAAGHFIRLRVRGHDQDGRMFWPDTAAQIEHEETGLSGLYHITGVTFSVSRGAGRSTELYLIKSGTELRLRS
jgi:prophage tail gpP-like protein